MWQAAAKPEIRTRRHQHQVVRAGRDGAYKCKADQSEEEFVGHFGILCGQRHNEIAKWSDFPINVQLMSSLDSISAAILRELERDGRISNLTLAEKVGLSPSACLRRVQDLEKRGIIKGYRARLDPKQTGRDYVVYVAVGLAEHTKDAQETFERAMRRADEVTECHNVAGVFEYMLRVEVADMTAYKSFHTETLGTVPHVRSITSYMVMGSPKDLRA